MICEMKVYAFSRPLWPAFEKATEWNACATCPIHLSSQGLVGCEMLKHLLFAAYNLCSYQLCAFLLSKIAILHLTFQTYESFLSCPASELTGTLLIPILEIIMPKSATSLFKEINLANHTSCSHIAFMAPIHCIYGWSESLIPYVTAHVDSRGDMNHGLSSS